MSIWLYMSVYTVSPLYLWMPNLWIWRADCTTHTFYIRNLSIHGSWYPRGVLESTTLEYWRTTVPHFVYLFICWWTFGWFPFFWLLWIMLLWTLVYKYLFQSLLSIVLGIYVGESYGNCLTFGGAANCFPP